MPESLRVLGGYGPAVRFVACASDEAIFVADSQADLLLEEGWAHADVALLTTQHRHPMQVELVETHEPVTVLDVGNNRVTQIKTAETDGYSAVQVTFGKRRASPRSRTTRTRRWRSWYAGSNSD